MFYSISFGLLIIGLIMMIGYFVTLLISNASYQGKDKNHLRNSFSYLYYANCSITTRLLLYALLIAGVLFLSLGEAFYFSSNVFSYYQLFLAILFPLSLFLIGLSNLLSLNNYKLKIFCSLFSFIAFTFASLAYVLLPFVEGLALEHEFYSAPIAIIIGVIGFICLISFFNPKLSSWAKMEKKEENGETYYVKPRVNYLALYEWSYLILMMVVGFLFFLNLILKANVIS